MRPLLFIICFFFFTQNAASQKVGLVLSGGASKGIAHVGVLKALEEHEIPIDYIVGTSMGAIIGAGYASGMSPAQLEALVTSQNFKNWVQGKPEEGFNFYYKDVNQTPALFRINLGLDSALNLSIKSSIASDVSINFALAEYLSQPSAIAGNNFDSLFVPIRLVAADIFRQQEVVFASGQLNEAVRASQSVPFFFTPVKVNGRYLFDGGIYNNFPVDIAEREFNPDVIIGVNVSVKKYEEYPYDMDDQLINNSLLMMLIDKADPSRIPEGGIFIEPDMSIFSGLDFSKAKEMIDSGYYAAMRSMPDIKNRIQDRVSCEDLSERRNAFNAKSKPFVFDRIVFEGFNHRQRKYMQHLFGINKESIRLNDLKKDYYKLVSEDYFKSVYAGIVFDTISQKFNFKLTRRPANKFQVDFGGNLSSRNISNMFLGLNYYHFSSFLMHTYADFYAGNFYKSAQLKSTFDFPYLGQFYIEPEMVYNYWDFLAPDDLLTTGRTPTALERIDRKAGVNIGKSLGNMFKVVASFHGVSNQDRFINTNVLSSLDTLDNLKLGGYKSGLTFATNSLNRKQYASDGRQYNFGISYFNVIENYRPGSTSSISVSTRTKHNWLRARLYMEQYFKQGFYSYGYVLEAVASNQPFFSNYTASLANAPGFYPMQDSRTIFLENFRAYNFAAAGMRNVFELRKSLDFRLEVYAFKPLERIVEGPEQRPMLNRSTTDFSFAGTAGLVFHSALGPVSLSFNYYDDDSHRFGLLLHVGFLLFNRPSLE